MTGILCSDYFMVRRQQLHVGDLYISGDKGVYWYWHGFNFRGVTAWCMGLWPLLREFMDSSILFRLLIWHSGIRPVGQRYYRELGI